MQTTEFIRGLNALKPRHHGSVVTIGAFDGVHLGHQQLLAGLNQAASDLVLPSAVVVFEPQPNEYFSPERAPARLTRLREKVAALNLYGIDRVVCLKFNAAMRELTANEFVETILVEKLGVKQLVVGDDFHFGSDRKGNFDLLRESGIKFGFNVVDTRTLLTGDTRVSSTYIRSLLAQGDLEKTSELLGRAYSNIGRVIYGRQLGRELGFPTMNVALGRLKVPLVGVFAVEVELDIDGVPQQFCGVANVGTRPTVNNVPKPLLEVHVFDENINAYGKFIKVTYRKKIRDEMRFDSVAELKAKIAEDVERAKAVFQ